MTTSRRRTIHVTCKDCGKDFTYVRRGRPRELCDDCGLLGRVVTSDYRDCAGCGTRIRVALPVSKRPLCMACEASEPVEVLAERVVDYRLRIVGALALLASGHNEGARQVLQGDSWPTVQDLERAVEANAELDIDRGTV